MRLGLLLCCLLRCPLRGRGRVVCLSIKCVNTLSHVCVVLATPSNPTWAAAQRQTTPGATEAADSDGLVQQRVHAGDAGEAPERPNAAQSVFCAAQAMICEPSCHRRAA